MSQKLAKLARKILRQEGVDYRQRSYDWRVRVHPNGYQQYIQRLLTPYSGRAIYKRLKRDIYHAVSS